MTDFQKAIQTIPSYFASYQIEQCYKHFEPLTRDVISPYSPQIYFPPQINGLHTEGYTRFVQGKQQKKMY